MFVQHTLRHLIYGSDMSYDQLADCLTLLSIFGQFYPCEKDIEFKRIPSVSESQISNQNPRFFQTNLIKSSVIYRNVDLRNP